MLVHEGPVSCNKDCGGGCPLWAQVIDGKLVSIRDNPHRQPFMRGCVRGYQGWRLLYAPDRLTQPLMRVGPRGSAQFTPIPWDEALDRIADKLQQIYQQYSPTSVLDMAGYGSGQGALHSTSRTCSRFLSLLGGYTYTTLGYSRGAANFSIPFVLGHGAPEGMDPGALQDSSLIILWGADFYVNRFGCEWEGRLQQARRRGVPIIGIDPRRSTTIQKLNAEWLPILPGTDAALMQALLYVLITSDRVDHAFLAKYTTGYAALRANILGEDGTPPKMPAWAAPLTGIPVEKITDLAQRYASGRPVALLPGLSIQRTVGGEEAIRLSIVLQAVSGNSGLAGASSGAHIWSKLPGPRLGGLPVPPPRQSASIPVLAWPDAVLGGRTAGYPSDIHAIYNVGGNYVVQGADIHKNMQAFEKVDLAVCHEWFMTPTARYCDIVLPASMPYEREDMLVTSTNMLLYSPKVVEPLPGVRDDFAIFCDLAERMGIGPQYSEGKTAAEWLASILQDSGVDDIAAFKNTGIFLGSQHQRSGLDDFRRDPLAHPLRTPSGKIELAPQQYALTGFSAVPTARVLAPDPEHPLNLITPVSRFRTHSQGSNVAWFREHESSGLWMNPADAVARRVSQGEQVEVYNSIGRMRIACRITEDIMPGVVCLLHGIWPEIDAEGVEVAGSANFLTTTEGTQPSGATRTHSIQVQVVRAAS